MKAAGGLSSRIFFLTFFAKKKEGGWIGKERLMEFNNN